MPAKSPLAIGIDPIDLAAGCGIKRIAQGRAAGIIPAKGAVERTLKFDNGVDAIASDWIAQIGPAFFPIVAPQMADLFFTVLESARVQVSTYCRKCRYLDCLTGTAAIGPGPEIPVVDAEMEIAVIRLRGGSHASLGED